jgi:hypothetical protein
VQRDGQFMVVRETRHNWNIFQDTLNESEGDDALCEESKSSDHTSVTTSMTAAMNFAIPR